MALHIGCPNREGGFLQVFAELPSILRLNSGPVVTGIQAKVDGDKAARLYTIVLIARRSGAKYRCQTA